MLVEVQAGEEWVSSMDFATAHSSCGTWVKKEMAPLSRIFFGGDPQSPSGSQLQSR
jgi:hypothetical protein